MIRVAVATALLVGCATVGRNFDSSSLDWLHEGATKAQIQEKLGQPLRVGSDAGVPTWTYGYYEYRLFGDSNNKDLVIRFAPDGTVKSYALSTTFPDEKKKLDPALR
ncbi:MAG TPA: outer membrane protein assembly factor BamE [Myxococcales bacterium]|nr:outer membrane protein assembly factor BamE [Myxococcales bacterium]